MKPETTQNFLALRGEMRRAYNIRSPENLFTIEDPIETLLHSAIQASAEFLNQITMLPVEDRSGQNPDIGVYRPIAGRTNTSEKDRLAQPMNNPDGLKYHCTLSEFDVHFDYDLLDSWARADNFQAMYMQSVYQRVALDRILAGWRGKIAAPVTDKTKNPNLEDLNVGWLELLRANRPEMYLTESTPGTGKITLGPKGDYQTLDQLVVDLQYMIEPRNRTYQEVAIIGQHLVADSVGETLKKWGQRPTEKLESLDVKKLEGTFGTLPAFVVPGFPDMGVCVTDPKNLCLYYQAGQSRRKMEDNPRKNRVENYISSNDAYSINNLDGIAAIEADNVEFAA